MTDSTPKTPDETVDLNPVTNHDAQEGLSLAHSLTAVMFLPLKSGNLAVFGRDFQLHTILYEAPSMEDIRRFSREIHAKLTRQKILDAEAHFLGEPDAAQLARDIKRSERREPRGTRSEATKSLPTLEF